MAWLGLPFFGETEGLLTYTEREFIGLENRCQIVKSTPQANRIELQLKCNGEGMISSTREVVQLLRAQRGGPRVLP